MCRKSMDSTTSNTQLTTLAAYKQCSICEDSTGISKHYGGICCSGCRGFFRRTVRFNRHYVCAREGNCDTRKNLRNCCRSCRYEKCIRAGLNPLLVHSDRACDKTLKRCKLAHDEIEMPTSSPEDDSSSNSNDQVVSKFDALTAAMQEQRMKNLALIEGRKLFKADGLPLGCKNILEQLSSRDFTSVQRFFMLANRLCDDFYDNENNHLLATKQYYMFNLNASVEEAFLIEPRSVSDRTKIDWSARFFLSGNDFKKVWCRISVYYVDWVSHIPELDLLDETDKLNLIIGRCVPSVWLIFAYKAYLYQSKDCFVLSGGSYFPMNQEEQLFYSDPILSKFLKEMCTWVWEEVVESARNFHFTEAEFALLKVLCFMTSVPSLSPKGKKIVHEAQNFYRAALSNLVLNNPSCQTFDLYTQRLSSLLMTLPALEKTTQIEDDHLALMTMFDIGGLHGELTYQFYVRRTSRA